MPCNWQNTFKSYRRIVIMDKLDINIKQFFYNIKERTIPEIEIYNTVEKLTDGFKLEPLKSLLDDFQLFVIKEKRIELAKYTSEDIKKVIDDFKKRGLKIPYIFYPMDSTKDENGKNIKIPIGENIDMEKLLYPAEFFGCERFEELLRRLINKNHTINEEKPNDIQTPINKFPTIFIDGYAYEFFEKLRSEIAINENSYANYSFIMQKMITDKFLIQTNHYKLIQFLDKEYKTDIEKKYIQFKVSTASNKKAIYERLFKEFQPKINSIL
jgi:hypothetical protein